MKTLNKSIKTLILYKINKMKKLGVVDINNFDIHTFYIDNDVDSLVFSSENSIMLPISKYPYIYIKNKNTKEVFFLLTFLDSRRNNFDQIMKNYYLFGSIFNNIKSKYVNM